jgi:hypothetical protein
MRADRRDHRDRERVQLPRIGKPPPLRDCPAQLLPLMQAIAIVGVIGVVLANAFADLLCATVTCGFGTNSEKTRSLAQYPTVGWMAKRVSEPLGKIRPKIPAPALDEASISVV